MKRQPGRPKWKAPDGQSVVRPGQTQNASLAPRAGQRTKSPLRRFQESQRSTYARQAPSYAIGRTRRMA